MSRIAVASAVLLAAATNAQTYSNTFGVYTVTQDTGADIPLASKHFLWPYLPEKADSGSTARGIQVGYNICNASTLGPSSMCQTAHINDISDFCIWGSALPDETVANEEAGMVAFCTTEKWGSRVLAPGTLQGVQFITTPDYIEVVGFLDQTKINLLANDTGGEEDPHGADFRGNPLGSLLYTDAFKTAGNAVNNVTQVIEWDYFVGSGVFCYKACNPAGANAAQLCNHIYDEIGCNYNSPADYNAINGTFTNCLGDDQTPAGVFVTNGVTTTWVQPFNVDFTVPYTPTIPATSSCTSFSSNQLYSAASSSAASSAASGKSKGASSTITSGASGATTTPAPSSSKSANSGAMTHGVAGALALGVAALFALLA